ncbi:TonB-dependent receptor [Caulobacter sp.]|uniref:TonB-dependent receptor n=1 Tax=Caulobacter sp. TaxID=78 RepID=UPI0025C3CA18|nr:TonB-dependent receptor [Caulobacter sp.]
MSALSIAALALAAPLSAQAVTRFDIPAQDARSALMALCLKAGCAFALSTEPGRTYRANTVSGTMAWPEAIKRLLAGTGLRYELSDHASVRVWAEAPTAAPPGAAPRPEEPVGLDEVTITAAFVAGIEDALLQKRRADAIVDAVSAGRIGELPAANLAEALQRVPGVAIEREVGEGQFVSVRGLGPLFQSVTLNGAPVAFNENIRNSTQSGRQFRFRALSADLLAGAVVAKSATADIVDGGIGSNIDIRTVRGLEGPSYLSLRADAHAEVRSGAVSPDLAISGRWRRADDRLGVVAGVSTERREVQYDRFQVSRYRDFAIGGASLTLPEDIRTTVEQEQRARATAFIGVEWRAAPAVTVYLDALASRFDNGIREDRVVYGISDFAAQILAAGDAKFEGRTLVGGRVGAGQISNNLEVSDQIHDNVSASLAMKADAGAWTLEPRFSLSSARSNLDTPLQRIGAVSPLGVSYAFDLGPDLIESRKAPLLSTTFDLTDPAQLTFSRYGVRATHVEDHDATGLIAAARPIDWAVGPLRFDRLRLGGQITDRGRNFQRRDREAEPRPGTIVDADFFDIAAPRAAFDRLVASRPPAWTAADFAAFREHFYLPGEADGVVVDAKDLAPTGADLQGSYKVGERILAAYGRLDFSTTVLGKSATGNIGVRTARTRTEVAGSLQGVSAAGYMDIKPVRYAGSHAVVLPSANLAIALDDDWRLRLAASRSITRPSLADLRSATVPASSLVSILYQRGQAEIDNPSPGTLFSGVGGNPELKPYLATNFDLSLEREFEGFGGVSLAVFHKSIDDFIVVSAQPERLAFATRAGPPVVATVMMSRPRNAGQAHVTGLEAAFSRRFAHGFGVWTSATWVDAASRNEAGQRGRLNGVSRLSYSISPFVERSRLHAHLSWTWRSPFGSEADMQGGGVSSFVVASAGYLDAAGSYDLSPRVSIHIEASNLTDTVEAAYENQRSRPLQIGRSGRSFGLGLRMRL